MKPDHLHLGWAINEDFAALFSHMEVQHGDALVGPFTLEQLHTAVERAHLIEHLPLVECSCCGAMVPPVPVDVTSYSGRLSVVAGRPDCPCPDTKR